MPRRWEGIVDGMSPVQKLVHLAMRRDSLDEEQIRGELTRMRRRAYEDELTIQARRVGCGGRRGRLIAGPSLTALNELSITDAAGIVNTYNYDLAIATLNIRAEVPTANRHVYAHRLSAWEAKRNQWKGTQIAQYTEGSARSMAQQDFVSFNDIQGYAVLMPREAVCPVCIGWVQRGQVPLNVAMNNPGPWHPGCPHLWETQSGKVAQSECPNLWVGD